MARSLELPTGMGHFELVPAAGASADDLDRVISPWRAEWELDALLAREPWLPAMSGRLGESFPELGRSAESTSAFASGAHAALREALRSGRLLLLGPVHADLADDVDVDLEAASSSSERVLPSSSPRRRKRRLKAGPVPHHQPAAPPPKAAKPAAPPAPPPPPLVAPSKAILSVAWNDKRVFCAEQANFHGSHVGFSWGDKFDAQVLVPGDSPKVVKAAMAATIFTGAWFVKDVLPADKKELSKKLDVTAGGKKSPDPLLLQFVPSLKTYDYSEGRVAFTIETEAYSTKVSSVFKFVPGWGGEVVKLGTAVDAKTGGLLDGTLDYTGYRWMKLDDADLKRKFWDGKAWQPLPKGFVLADVNNFAVGFYKDGKSFKCQYGGTWPGTFPDWDPEAKQHKQKIDAWEKNIHSTWTGKFDLKRKDCKSSDPSCCRYATRFEAKFSKQATFAKGMLVVAVGNVRSNDQLFFLGESRIAMAAHEFGHHIGNPDEYAGATLDTSLNDDGAKNGIDTDSIMGQGLTKVKKRHFSKVHQVFAQRVTAEYGKSLSYEAVPKT
jgi:hypothetical protein